MKKTLLTTALLSSLFVCAQQGFDYDQALNEAIAKGIPAVDHAGYVKLKHEQWMKANGLQNKSHDHQHTSAFKIIAANNALAATNIDFETGNYTGWNTFAGDNTLNSNGPLQNVVPMTPGANDSIYGLFNNNCNNSDTSGRQGLISAAMGNDPLGGFPLASPMGGNYVARVNRYCANYEGSELSQSFTVSAGQTWLNYAYAVVLEDGGHLPGEQTYFTAYVTDIMGNVIPCCVTYMQAANGLTPGFYPVNNPSYPSTYYKPWTPVSVDLAAYMGQTVTVHFIASGCIYAGHSGYAYVDARMDSVAGPGVVWPGDMNYDLTADMNDLLYLGWAYGSTGTVRAGATNNWQAEISANWNASGPYGVDYKHADANGDGMIDLNDTTALIQNFALTHAYKLANPVNALATRSMSITPSTTSISPGQTFYLDVDLGSSGIVNADSIFSISFQVNTPPALIASLNNSDFSNSFMGVKNSTIAALTKDLVTSGNMVPVGIARINHSNANGSGNLVRLYFTADNWSGTVNGTFSISNISLVTESGSYNTVNGAAVTLNFTNGTNGIQNHNAQNAISTYPNPAKDLLFLSGLNSTCRVEVLNLLGETIINTQTSSSINVASLSKGNYFVRIFTSNGVVTKKFIKE